MNLTTIQNALAFPNIPLESFISKNPRRWPSPDLRKYCWEWGANETIDIVDVSRTLYYDRLSWNHRLIHICGNPACVNPHHHLAIVQRVNRPSLFDRLERYLTYYKPPSQSQSQSPCWIWTGPLAYGNKPTFTYLKHHITDVKLLVSELHGQRLRPGQSLHSTCNDPMCVNPHHQKPHQSRVRPKTIFQKGDLK